MSGAGILTVTEDRFWDEECCPSSPLAATKIPGVGDAHRSVMHEPMPPGEPLYFMDSSWRQATQQFYRVRVQ